MWSHLRDWLVSDAIKELQVPHHTFGTLPRGTYSGLESSHPCPLFFGGAEDGWTCRWTRWIRLLELPRSIFFGCGSSVCNVIGVGKRPPTLPKRASLACMCHRPQKFTSLSQPELLTSAAFCCRVVPVFPVLYQQQARATYTPVVAFIPQVLFVDTPHRHRPPCPPFPLCPSWLNMLTSTSAAS